MDERSAAAPDSLPEIVPPPPAVGRPGKGRGVAPASARQPAQPQGGVKETIESILVAFILAFIFRAFVVEAFVIPTGSMAPTLLGAHMRFACPDCGYRWDTNFSSELYKASNGASDDVDVPNLGVNLEIRNGAAVEHPLTFHVHCPNCGMPVREGNSAAPVPVHYGDRILVLKYAYLLQKPQRWDVVVFKSPTQPEKFNYTVNYIKRLVGNPGETLMVLDGDVYVSTEKDVDDARRAWKVQTKPSWVQDALWRLVYDNDFHPLNAPARPMAWKQPWTPRAGTQGWDTAPAGTLGKAFAFDNAAGSGALDFDPACPPDLTLPGRARARQSLFHDWLAYDDYFPTLPGPFGGDAPAPNFNTYATQGKNLVGDLKLDVYYQRTAGDGPMKFRLTKLDHAFTAVLEGGKARLLHRRPGEAGDGAEVASADFPLPARAVRVELMNVDYRVTLRLDGKDVLRTTEAQYAPDVPDLVRRQEQRDFSPPAAAVEASRQACRLEHVKLMRDVYYTPEDAFGESQHQAGPYQGRGGGPVHLGDNEFFVMGDNSIQSYDARFWATPIQRELLANEGVEGAAGRVPGRFMLGKAFFVYWPAGFRPVSNSAPGLAPNFGEMRFIH